jgi:23S rRNA pseudouridine1911/1915/1917 synthase
VAERESVRRLRLRVPASAAGTRLDRFLAAATEVGTRSQAKRLIDAGLVRVDGRPRKGGHALGAGATVDVEVPQAVPTGIVAEALPLTVLWEDAHVLAIDKPAGMVVHPAPGWRRGTLVNALAHHLGTTGGPGDAERPGIVHRLDRDTSGVLLVARTTAALEGLARQFRGRTVEKRYLAVVRGRLTPEEGTIDRPIGRHPRERKRMTVAARRGRAALTRWTVLEQLTGATLVRLRPETGRTHQLRVHLAATGHPIVGDPVYGARRGGRGLPAVAADFPRQALHAEEIRFAHPVTGERLAVRAPLPADLLALLDALRQGRGCKGGISLRNPRS